MNLKNFFLAIVPAILLSSACLPSCKKDDSKPDFIKASPTSLTLSYQANTTATININCNGDWYVASKPDWINVSPTSGNENADVKISALTDNESTSSRSGEVEFKCGSISVKAQIIQSGKDLEIIEVNPTSVSLVSSANSSANVNIICNGMWSITTKPDWINVSSNSGKGNTSLTITAISENDSSSPRSGNLEIVSGQATANLLISQIAGLESGCEVKVIDEVILNTSATFRLKFGSKASYFYGGYFPASSAGWSDTKIVEELENFGEPLTASDNYDDITAYDLEESTSYIQCVVAYNEKGKRGDVLRIKFTTPSSKDAPDVQIYDVSYSSTMWYFSTKKGATAQEYYMLAYSGETAFFRHLYYQPSDIAMIIKDKVDKMTSYLNDENWKVDRGADETDLLICTWAQRDKKWSPVLNMFYGYISEEDSEYMSGSVSPCPTKQALPKGLCTFHSSEEREILNKHLRIIKM